MANTARFFHTMTHFMMPKRPQPRRMSTPKLLLLMATFIGLCAVFGNSQADSLDSYRFAADDQISITVFGEPDLSLATVRIATNGSISIPLIGQVRVQGLTANEIEKKIARLFANGYLQKPTITVSIIEYRQFYINGEVNRPGGYSYREGLTVERAVALAGGFSERASKGKISIVHEKSSNKASRVELTTPVRPGDVITVEESFF